MIKVLRMLHLCSKVSGKFFPTEFLVCCIFVISVSFVFCIPNHMARCAAIDEAQQNVSYSQFPLRQVENNVAVEFSYIPLPDDEKGFEKEVQRLMESFKSGGNQIEQDNHVEHESENSKRVSKLNNQGLVRAGHDVALVFKVTDAAMNRPIQGQGFVPDSPIRMASGQGNLEYTKKQITKRAKLYGGHFPINEYAYLFVLNIISNTISVIDSSSLYTGAPIEIIPLSDGADCKSMDIDMEWLGRYAYVVLSCGKVAVVDCMRMKIIRMIQAGADPHHVYVQPDGKFVWVCNDGDNTLTVIDTETQKVVSAISVGKGHHEIAFTEDSRYACVTNQEDNNVAVIDVYSLSVEGFVGVGKQPHGLGFSNLSGFMYVANEGEGSISVVNPKSRKMLRTIPVGKGVRKVRFGPDSRYGFAPNRGDDTCSMIDVTRDTVIETIKTGKGPEDVSFAPNWVFIRNTGSSNITAMSMEHYELVKNIPIGYKIPDEVDLPLGHVYMTPQGDGHSVLVPSPGERAVYRYAPGEAAAGGTVPTDIFNTKSDGSSKIMVYYRGLKEVSSGVYMRTVRFNRSGRYEIGFYIDNPELTACFELYVAN